MRSARDIALASLMLMLGATAYAQEPDKLEDYMRNACPEVAKWNDAHRSDGAGGAAATSHAPTHPKELKQLLAMRDVEQRAREAWRVAGYTGESAEFVEVKKIDQASLAKLQNLIADGGFPSYERVGSEGVAAAWLVVQHADTEPALQAQVLKGLNPKSLPKGITGREFALLSDRVAVNHGQPQRYGSQFHQVDGKWVAYAIEDRRGLDARRDELGLIPYGMYACGIAAMTSPDAQK